MMLGQARQSEHDDLRCSADEDDDDLSLRWKCQCLMILSRTFIQSLVDVTRRCGWHLRGWRKACHTIG